MSEICREPVDSAARGFFYILPSFSNAGVHTCWKLWSKRKVDSSFFSEIIIQKRVYTIFILLFLSPTDFRFVIMRNLEWEAETSGEPRTDVWISFNPEAFCYSEGFWNTQMPISSSCCFKRNKISTKRDLMPFWTPVSINSITVIVLLSLLHVEVSTVLIINTLKAKKRLQKS